MVVHDQPVVLVASPSYPNSVVWSEENLVAIASGHLITILNPASPVHPRGMVTLPPSKPFPVGVVKRDDLLTGCLMPTCLSRDVRPCVRSVAWSPLGFAPNSGCLLAVCTTEGRVKLYRSPFCEFCPEWVEVVDISDMLYDYLESTNYGDLKSSSQTLIEGLDNSGHNQESRTTNELHDPLSSWLTKRRKTKSNRTGGNKYIEFEEELSNHGALDVALCNTYDENRDLAASRSNDKTTKSKEMINPCSNIKQGSSKRSARCPPVRKENGVPPLINPQQYTSRTALLSSLVVVWSPVLQSFGEDDLNFMNGCAILAVGGKSGNLSFWRIYEPECYTIENARVHIDPVLVGLLHAHTSWVTAISWGLHTKSSSKTQLILATGSCDGSVKIWVADAIELTKSLKSSKSSFSLLKEVTASTSSPISTMSLVVPVQFLDKAILAIGRGSGSLEVCICHISSNTFECAGVYNVHNQVVTGLVWAFDGYCLYSCSQDNSLRSWVLQGSSLHEIPFPMKFPGLGNSSHLSHVSDLCFGLALSPGELMVAAVCSLDSRLLNQMYQARAHKAAVEFYWIGKPSVEIRSDNRVNGGIETSDLTDKDLLLWESTTLWSLTHYEKVEEPLVLWDILTTLLAFKKSIPDFLEKIMCQWISSWFTGYQSVHSIEKILSHARSMLSKLSTRRMHLLSIICRMMLSQNKADTCPIEVYVNGELPDVEGKLDIWDSFLADSERELQERFVAFTFKAVLNQVGRSSMALANDAHWYPVGVAQMEQWVAINHTLVHNQLKLLGLKIRESRANSKSEYLKETCSYCSASVSFESSDFAKCEGVKNKDRTTEFHDLKRCAVSMQLADIMTPMWHCRCCRRCAANLPPESFFTMSESPFDVSYESENFAARERRKPLCIYCGVLMQRHLPDFLLSASPV